VRGGNSRDRIRAQLSSSHCLAGDFGSGGIDLPHCCVARRGDILVVGCWSPAGQCHPVHAACDPATNKVLLSPKLDRRSVEAGRLLARWGALHAVRSVLSGLALLLFLYLVIFKKLP